ncbi:hypothetical protein BAnh1_09920 [Bartonella australis AUST/NH1]|uniref:Uncharacterized protein n=1 Tax=Bartonella australis (strain Aust/NH1) TaxID=1094489 RepID=M1NZL3_BARAA|nr:hypothetical protein [Bartonella australis]AGF74862.1 hypothetical protein BAnh1_09920 [Bartonella australis AUST/NH1]
MKEKLSLNTTTQPPGCHLSDLSDLSGFEINKGFHLKLSLFFTLVSSLSKATGRLSKIPGTQIDLSESNKNVGSKNNLWDLDKYVLAGKALTKRVENSGIARGSIFLKGSVSHATIFK